MRFTAELAGAPVATGALSIHDGLALLAGVSTVLEDRTRGATWSVAACTPPARGVADVRPGVLFAEPGSASQRNAERHGFRIAYTRMKCGSAIRSVGSCRRDLYVR